MLRIKLVKSAIGNTKRNRAIVQALGLRRTQQIVEHDDVPAIRGMVHKVKHLLLVETVEGTVTRKNSGKTFKATHADKTAVADRPSKAKPAPKAKAAKAEPKPEPKAEPKAKAEAKPKAKAEKAEAEPEAVAEGETK